MKLREIYFCMYVRDARTPPRDDDDATVAQNTNFYELVFKNQAHLSYV